MGGTQDEILALAVVPSPQVAGRKRQRDPACRFPRETFRRNPLQGNNLYFERLFPRVNSPRSRPSVTRHGGLWYNPRPMIRENRRVHARKKRDSGLLDRVLESWGLAAHAPPTLDTLNALHSAYLTRVPFENATKLIKAARAGSARGAIRGPVEFWEEYLRWGSGGTCFAATNAYQFLLRYVGFSSRPVFCQLPATDPDAHSALLVTVGEQPVLVDVGYALPAPLPLPGGTALRRATPFYDLEIRTGPQGEYLVFSEDDRGSRFRYRFTLRDVADAEYSRAWRSTFRPDAPYMGRLALGRFKDGTRYLYKNPGSVFVITRAGEAERSLDEPSGAALADLFAIPKPLIEAALSSLAALAR